jgi:exonuclease III
VPHIIAGDFNALCRDDYSPEYLEEISRVRDEGRWEAPHFDVIQLMLSRGYIDVFRRINPDLKDANVVTNRFNTRIDYIFISASLAEKINWQESDCIIVDRPDISDHLPLAADLVLL